MGSPDGEAGQHTAKALEVDFSLIVAKMGHSHRPLSKANLFVDTDDQACLSSTVMT